MRAPFTLALLTLAFSASAQVPLRIVGDYLGAAQEGVWRDVPADTVAPSLVSTVSVDRPSHAYAGLFPRHFFQEEGFVVCYRSCLQADLSTEWEAVSGDNRASLEQQTVYHWLSRFLGFAQDELGLAPARHLQVLPGRLVGNLAAGRILRNNAYFMPTEHTLSFLPASNNPLFNLLAGKINRSGFDPSVIVHEAGHALFMGLVPRAANAEIMGLNEGFADYLANIFLETPKLGLVMLRGRVLRDSSSNRDGSNNPKIYAPKLEVHDLGERFSTALWKSRALAPDPRGFDLLVVQAVRELGLNPWATAHTFKDLFLALAAHEINPDFVTRIAPIWEAHLAGQDRNVSDQSFTQSPVPAQPQFTLRQTGFVPGASGLGPTRVSKVFHRWTQRWTPDRIQLLLTSTQDGVAPRWIAYDPDRSNSLGVWGMDGAADNSDAGVALAQDYLRSSEAQHRNRIQRTGAGGRAACPQQRRALRPIPHRRATQPADDHSFRRDPARSERPQPGPAAHARQPRVPQGHQSANRPPIGHLILKAAPGPGPVAHTQRLAPSRP